MLLASLEALLLLALWPQHNVLLIVADDLGVGHVGCYGIGTDPPPTPNLDALARRGVRFTNAWSMPCCSPTRACIQTGRYPFRTGVGNSNLNSASCLQAAELTIPEVLPGIPCAAVGKWHLDLTWRRASPFRHGYQYYRGCLAGSLASYYWWPSTTTSGATSLDFGYATTRTIDDALAWLARQRANWFCYVALNAPHLPYQVPPPHLHSYTLRNNSSNVKLTYKAMIEALDTELGRLLSGIDESRTTVIFVGDNGGEDRIIEPPFDPQRAKGTVYEGGVWVPLIVAGPGVTSPGRAEHAIVNVVDLYSTIVELMGGQQETGVDSVSLVPYLRRRNAAPRRRFSYTETFNTPSGVETEDATFARAIRDQRFKLVQLGTGTDITEEHFYDLRNDRYETIDLMGDQRFATSIHRLHAALMHLLTAESSGRSRHLSLD
jgi:arylsulfatase B